MWLALIVKNLKNFLLYKTVLFIFIMLSLIICIITSLLIVGMADAVTPDPAKNLQYDSKYFHIDLTESANQTQEEPVYCIQIFDLKEKKFLYVGESSEEAEKIRREVKNPVSESIKQVSQKDYSARTYAELKKNILYVVNKCREDLFDVSIGGSIESDGSGTAGYASRGTAEEWLKKNSFEEQAAENWIEVVRNPYYESPFQKLEWGDKISLGTTEYVVSKIQDKPMEPPDISTVLTVNAGGADDTFTVRWVTYTVTADLDQAGIARVSEAIKTAFGDMNPTIDVPEPPPLMEKQFNNMVYVLALIIILVVLLNVSRLYAYIMSTRKKALAVFSLCGAGKLTLFAVYMTEIMLMLLGSFLLGWTVFHFGLKNLIAVLYPSFAEFFTPAVYLTVFGIYIGAGIIMMALNLIPFVRRSVIQLMKEGT